MEEEKKVYTAPELTVYGNVKAITQVQPDPKPGKRLVGGDGQSDMGWS